MTLSCFFSGFVAKNIKKPYNTSSFALFNIDHLLLAWLVLWGVYLLDTLKDVPWISTMLKAPPGAPYAPAVGDAQKWTGFSALGLYSPES